MIAQRSFLPVFFPQCPIAFDRHQGFPALIIFIRIKGFDGTIGTFQIMAAALIGPGGDIIGNVDANRANRIAG